jgi:hypothetical protein
MQRIQLLFNVLVLAITAFVTIGSLYISVEAASQQGVDLDAPDSTMPSDLVTGVTAETAQSNGDAAMSESFVGYLLGGDGNGGTGGITSASPS